MGVDMPSVVKPTGMWCRCGHTLSDRPHRHVMWVDMPTNLLNSKPPHGAGANHLPTCSVVRPHCGVGVDMPTKPAMCLGYCCKGEDNGENDCLGVYRMVHEPLQRHALPQEYEY